MKYIFDKAKRKVWSKVVKYTRNKAYYLCIYSSYWHFLLSNNKKNLNLYTQYFSARPNPGAGIGHQIANWIAGYWFAQQFKLKFAHIPFSTQKWDDFLGFGKDEESVESLIEFHGYQKVKLPLFDECNNAEIAIIKKIITAYAGKKVIFIAEQDQFYKDQFGVINDIRRKFFAAPARLNNQLLFNDSTFNIVIHIRRGDIITDLHNNPNLSLRFQENSYFVKILESVLMKLQKSKPIRIFLFSQENRLTFSDFEHFPDIEFCLDVSAMDSFLNMVYADILITSKSSFSYKPALISEGIKICPRNFWHSYPNEKQWILAGDDGSFDEDSLLKLQE